MNTNMGISSWDSDTPKQAPICFCMSLAEAASTQGGLSLPPSEGSKTLRPSQLWTAERTDQRGLRLEQGSLVMGKESQGRECRRKEAASTTAYKAWVCRTEQWKCESSSCHLFPLGLSFHVCKMGW